MKKINTLITSTLAFVVLGVISFIAIPAVPTHAISGDQFAAGLSMPAPTTDQYTCAGKTEAECIQQNPIIEWIAFFVNVVAAVVGVGAVIMVIVAGLQYSSARDNAQSIQAAKQKLINVLIGLAAFIFLYSFMQWLIPGGVFGKEYKSPTSTISQSTNTQPTSSLPASPQPDSSEFIIGKTMPNEDNTGIIDTNKLKKHTGDLIITKAGTVIDGMDIKGFISIRADNVTIKNSIIRGRDSDYNNACKGHLIDTSNSSCVNAVITNNIIRPDYPRWWINGIHGGNFTASKNNISGTVDGFSITKGKTKIIGNYLHDFYFSDQSKDQASSTPPKWTHNDGIQFRGGPGAGPHIVEGNNFYWYPGSGSYYNRNRALQLGYSYGPDYYNNLQSEKTGRYNWGAGITISPDDGPVIGGKVSNNWFEGGQVAIQANYSYRDRSMNFGSISNNLFGGDQLVYKNSSYQIRYDKNIQISGLLTNKWGDLPTVPASKQGDNFYVGTNGGIRIN